MATETRRARLVLPASGAAPAVLEVEPQPRARRAARAAAIVVGTVALAPATFLVPPHFLWPLVVLAVGFFFARRHWIGEYVVRSFEGACPRCGEALTVDAGARVRARQPLECYGCHREPELVLAEPDG